MAELIEKSDIAKLYTRLTGITANLDELIADCADEKEKAELMESTLWHLKRGAILPEDGALAGEYAMGYKTLVTELADTLDIATSGDVNLDGNSDEDDEKIIADINFASTLEIEVPSDSSDENNGVLPGVDIE